MNNTNINVPMNTIENKSLADKAVENIKALEWLRSYKIWDNTKGEEGWKTYEWQLCKLGGYCFNLNGHEDPEPKRTWKDYEEEKGEREYKDHLKITAIRATGAEPTKVDCDCQWIKKGDQRILYIKVAKMKTWSNKGWHCRDHVQEKVEWYIKNQEPNPWAKKGGPVLQEKPVWGVNFEEAKRRAEELTKKPFRT